MNLSKAWPRKWLIFSFLLILIILDSIDIGTTALLSSRFGISGEHNLIARNAMYQYGIVPGLVLTEAYNFAVSYLWVLVPFALCSFLIYGISEGNTVKFSQQENRVKNSVLNVSSIVTFPYVLWLYWHSISAILGNISQFR